MLLIIINSYFIRVNKNNNILYFLYILILEIDTVNLYNSVILYNFVGEIHEDPAEIS